MERMRLWRGRLKEGREEEHARFVQWLQSSEGHRSFSRFGLTGYRCEQDGSELTVTMMAEEPLAVIRFLRNPKLWPEFWEFVEARAPGPPERTPEGQARDQGKRTLVDWAGPER